MKGLEQLKRLFSEGRPQVLKVWSIALLAGVLIPVMMQWFNRFELMTFDERQLLVHENRAESGISLVEIDNATLNHAEMKALFGRYPWRREIYGYAFRFFDRADAKAVLLEPSFTGGQDLDHPESDQHFLESISGKTPVLTSLSSAKRDEVTPFESAHERDMLFHTIRQELVHIQGPPIVENRFFQAYQIPLPGLLNSPAKVYPSDNLVFDDTNKVRRTVLFGRGRILQSLPTLPVGALLVDKPEVTTHADGTVDLGSHSVHLYGEPEPIIRWYGQNVPGDKARGTYPRYTLADVVKSQIWWECHHGQQGAMCQKMDFTNFTPLDPTQFHGRYILVGYTSSWFDSSTATTLYDRDDGDSTLRYPNLFIQANILDNLLHDDFVRRTPWRIPIPFADSISLITIMTVMLFCGMTVYGIQRTPSVFLTLIMLLALGIAYTSITTVAYLKFNLWLSWVYPMFGMVATYVSTYIYQYSTAERRKQQMRMAFAKYMSPSSLAYIEKNLDRIELGCQRRQITTLFCDIRGFTGFAEQHPPAVVQEVLGEYFKMMNAIIIHDYSGVINKLMGDAILAYWGFPLNKHTDPLTAVSAALAMKAALEKWQTDPDKPPLHVGIGINTGDCLIGNIGSDDFMDFTVIGDSVNTASRLEKLNKLYGTTIIISGSTYERVKKHIKARYLGQAKLQGKSTYVDIYEPIGFVDQRKLLPKPTKIADHVRKFSVLNR